MSFLAAAVVVGAAYQMYSNNKEADAQQEAAESKAAAKRAQAEELLDRFFINSSALSKEADFFKGSQTAAFAKGGVDVGTGSSLLALEETNRTLLRRLELDEREANNKAKLLRMGADLDTKLGGDIQSANKRKNVGIFLDTAASASKASGN